MAWAAAGIYARTQVDSKIVAMRTVLQERLSGLDIQELEAVLNPPSIPELPADATVSRDAEGWRIQVPYRFMFVHSCLTISADGGESVSSSVLPECPALDVNRLAMADRGGVRA